MARTVYDALISPWVYKPAFSHKQALPVIPDGCSSYFDPGPSMASNASVRPLHR